MLDAERDVTAFVQGRARVDLDADRMLSLAVVKALEVIGEAASRVTEGFRDAHPEIPWRPIIGMRYVLVHGYFRIDLDRVWAAATADVPALIAVLEPIVPPWRAPDE